MKLLLALYLLTVTASLSVPVAHERCDDWCEGARAAAAAQITSNYKPAHRVQQIKRDRERLALLYTEQAALNRAIERAKKGKL